MTSRLLSFAAVLLPLAASTAAEPPVPKFKAITIDDEIQIGYGVAVADVDGDKHPDVLLADKKQFVWYRNPGPASPAATPPAPAPWDKFVLAENLTEKDNVCLAAQDIDGDGKCEVAVGGEWNPGDTVNSGAVFYLIPPEDRTQKWTPVRLYSKPTVHRMHWIQMAEPNPHGGHRWALAMLPLHGVGNKNGEGETVRMVIYHPAKELPKQPENPAPWVHEEVDTGMHMTHNFEISHVPGTASFIAGKEGVRLFLRAAGRWVGAPVEQANEQGAGEVREVLMKAGGGMFLATISPMHGNRLTLWKTRAKKLGGNRFDEKLPEYTLTEQLTEGHALACGKILESETDDVVVGWRGSPGKPGSTTGVAIWTALDQTGAKWRETVIDPDGMACEDLKLADLNGDGKLDIVASGRATKNVKIYFNETP